MFKRIFLNLCPGGRLILERQPLSLHKKKKNLTVSDYFKVVAKKLSCLKISREAAQKIE